MAKMIYKKGQLIGVQIDNETYRIDTREIAKKLGDEYDREINKWLSDINILKAVVKSKGFFDHIDRGMDRMLTDVMD